MMANLKFSFLFFILILNPAFGFFIIPKRHCIKSIYSLGDSIADTGNLLHEGGAVAAFNTIANLPYGKTIGRPTGRCSDGLLMIDFLARGLHLPVLTPYLAKDGNFKHGVNFAVAGATALDKTFFEERGILMPYTNSSLNVQLEWFKTHLKSTCSSPSDIAKKLKQALVLVGEIGGNDYNYAFLAGKTQDEMISYVPQVVQTIINAAQEVIDLGAVRVVVPGNFPIGCMPVYLTAVNSKNQDDYDSRKCLRSLNSFAKFHNTKLREALEDLRKSNPHVHIIYADYYNALLHILDNASVLGFDESSLQKACCGSGGDYNFGMTKLCGSPGVSACENPATHISWDGIHLTQEAYKFMILSLVAKLTFTNPQS